MKNRIIALVVGMVLLLFTSSIYSQTPDTLWTKTYGGNNTDMGYSVKQTTDGGYIIGGYTMSFGAGYADYYLIRTDENGDTIWEETFGANNGEFCYAVQQTSDGGFIAAGYTESCGNPPDIFSVYRFFYVASFLYSSGRNFGKFPASSIICWRSASTKS